jgi:hypothetical protein
MSNKIKTSNSLNDAAKQLGYLLLIGATTLGMLDMPDRLNSRVILPNQPAFAFANNNLEASDYGSNVRREREEVAPHYISFSEVQRTASRAGRR